MSIANGFDTDITARKHGNNPNSDAAYQRIKDGLAEECLKVLGILAKHPDGLTGKEVAQLMGKAFNEVSGRMSDLKRAGYAFATAMRRDGGAVVRITDAGRAALYSKAQRSLFV